MRDIKVLPLVYILTPNKTSRLYTKVLKKLIELKPDLKPKTIIIDYEKSFTNAFQACFPTTKIRGCHFHYGQCMYHYVQSTGMQTRYGNNIEYSVAIRMLIAFAFVPEDDVHDAYEELINSDYFTDNQDNLKEIIKYCEATWDGPNAMFPCSMWNVYQAVLDDLPRSNNAIEGWHHGFNERIRVSCTNR